MKQLMIVSLSILFSYISINAQEKTKDTLFFSIDKYYTISPTITPDLSNQKYSEWTTATNEQIKHTNTNGYIYFVGDGFLTTGLRPKKILSIKEYIENRKFYYDGRHNNLVDNYKLQDSLFNKYVIYFVNDAAFLQPRYLEYKSYYPRRNKKGDWIANPIQKKDTLYFNLDNEYVYPSKYNKTAFLIKDGGNEGSGMLYFQRIENEKPINNPVVLDLERYIHHSIFFNKNDKILDKRNLKSFLSNYVLYFVTKKENNCDYIQVQPMYVIE
nr:hypothetical protein [uncultured Flavobacterium sp.]